MAHDDRVADRESSLQYSSGMPPLSAELSPPTFPTFRRELSSVWQTVSYPRTACNVLEQLSGVTERRMIVPMTVRPQQRYDHRLRDLVQRTEDVTIATDLGVLARPPVGGSVRPRKS